MKRTFRAALFDLDGTLIDTEGQYTTFWAEIGCEMLPNIPDFAFRIKGTTLTHMFATYFPEPEKQAIVKQRLDVFEAGMRYSFYPGALDFIQNIRANGVKCAIITSSNALKMEQVYKQLPELQTLFDRILTAEDFTASKPDPQCYRLGAEVFGLKPEECVVFEDAFTGLAAGMASGAYTIGLATGNPPESIRQLCHTVWTDWHDRTYGEVADLLSQVAP